jgi:SAM-dependent methyltransferase
MTEFKINPQISSLIRKQRTFIAKAPEVDTARLYYESCMRDFNLVQPYINEGDCVLDIGCGIGGVDVLISQSINKVKIHLLDKDEIPAKVSYGYKPEASVYNSTEAMFEFFKLNKAKKPKFFTEFPTKLKFDVITSHISLGFHYPVETYLSNIIEALNPGGRVILDIRHDKENKDHLCYQLGAEYWRKLISKKAYDKVVFTLPLPKEVDNEFVD